MNLWRFWDDLSTWNRVGLTVVAAIVIFAIILVFVF